MHSTTAPSARDGHEESPTDTSGRFRPLLARTRTIHRPVGPVAYDWVKLIFVRHGSAVLLSEFGEKPVTTGDVVMLGASTLCGSEPEGFITVTTLYLDRDYVIDQVFWQHVAVLSDRLDAQDFMNERYSEPAQILHLGEDRAGMLMPWLDELVALSIDGPSPQRFYRLQALLFAVLDVITPYVATTPVRQTSTQRKTLHPGLPRHRRQCTARSTQLHGRHYSDRQISPQLSEASLRIRARTLRWSGDRSAMSLPSQASAHHTVSFMAHEPHVRGETTPNSPIRGGKSQPAL